MSNLYGNHITRLAELAVRAYLRSIGFDTIPSASILAGFDDTGIVASRVVIICDKATLDGPADDATWECDVEIQCISKSDDKSAETHYQFAAEVWSQMMLGRYTVPDLINAAAEDAVVGFRCFDILPESQSKKIEDRHWMSAMTFKIIGCGVHSAVLGEDGEVLLSESGQELLS